MIETKFEHERGLTKDRVGANSFNDGGQTEESLNSVCLNDQELVDQKKQKNNYKSKKEDNIRFEEEVVYLVRVG